MTAFLTINELKSILPDPKQIVTCLGSYIIGQEAVKKALALMMLRRGLIGLQSEGRLPPTPLFDKSNVMILGPTGTGKTASINALSKILNTPVGMYDVTEITATGYVGKSIDSLLERYVIQCEEWARNNSFVFLPLPEEMSTGLSPSQYLTIKEKISKLINTGIIYLDEIDKIRRKETRGADVTGDSVQSELLKIIDGCQFDLWQDTKKISQKGNIESVNTTNISVICGGAFEGLDEVIKFRLKKNSGIGFNNTIIQTNPDDILNSVTTEDLIEYGFKPEFLGRMPLRATMHYLTKNDLIRIIKEPKNNLYEQYQLVFKLFNINFSIDDQAIDYLADQACKLKVGARSLKQVFSSLLSDTMFNIFDYSGEDININLQYVKDRI